MSASVFKKWGSRNLAKLLNPILSTETQFVDDSPGTPLGRPGRASLRWSTILYVVRSSILPICPSPLFPPNPTQNDTSLGVGQKVCLGFYIRSSEKPKQTFWPTQYIHEFPNSSFLARRIPWTGKPGGLRSMRSQRVRHE